MDRLNLYIKTFFALLAAALISSLKLDFFESFTYDTRVKISPYISSSSTSKNVSIILIDSDTVQLFRGYPSYSHHEAFLNNLKKLDPRFVIYDFRSENGELVDFTGNYNEKKNFAKSATQISDFYIGTNEVELKGSDNKLKLAPPLDNLSLASCPKTADSSQFAKDSVSRRIMFSYQEQSMLQPVIASYFNKDLTEINNVRGIFDVLDSKQLYIKYSPSGTFRTYKFEDVYNNKLSENIFTDQVIIVGMDTGRSSKDYALTPYSRDVTAMTTSELQANILQTLIDNNAPVKVPTPVNVAVTVLISLLTVYVVLALKPSKGLLILGATLVTVTIISIILLAYFDIWIGLAHPYLAIFLCYYFFIPYRLIIENRRSWEYIQKNQLLQQVEVLKTNFISMMSHDLKTPIARIQGMIEVILKDEVSLSSTQREAVDTIKGSSDDLLKFINSILQYGRIESQGVELHKQSKDINQLLKDVIKKHEFLARVKKIKVLTELEPLFPVQVDSDLMKQVFSNLIENAIKYSSEESTIKITSQEKNDSIVVQVSDSGVGIPAEDLPNIFMKFYRSQNVKTSTIKGTGLGLYLAQYFTELHKGKIEVTSEVNKGSVFTVTLPIES